MEWLKVSERRVPSANVALVDTGRPVLIDCGVGSPASDWLLARFLADHGRRPADITTLALTHFHNDHVGGAGWFNRLGVRVALHEAEAELVNAGAPGACDRDLLPFRVPPFRVDRPLADGDVVDAGAVGLHVVHVPSQTPGCVAYWEPDARVLFTGDLLQDADVGWVRFDPAVDDGALDRSIAAVEKLAALEPRLVVNGHGPVVEDVPRVVEETLARYRSWQGDPARPALHACRRILVTSVVVEPAREPELAATAWAAALGRALDATPAEAVARILADLEASGVVVRGLDRRIRATIAHEHR